MTATIDTMLALPDTSPHRSVVRPLRMVAHQVRYDLVSMRRNRAAEGFTLIMPPAFLVLFVAMFGNGTMHVNGVALRGSTYYVAVLSVFAVIDVAFMSLLIVLVDLRETGVLRRRRATPQPAWTIVAGRAVSGVLTGALSASLLLVIGRIAYGATVPLGAVPALVVSVLVGVACFCALGFAVASLVRSFQAAQPVAMGLALPLTFISGVFVPWAFVPPWLQHVAGIFPVRALAVALLDPFVARGGRSPWDPEGLAILAAWGVAGLVIALHRFRWAPQDV